MERRGEEEDVRGEEGNAGRGEEIYAERAGGAAGKNTRREAE